MTIKIIDGKRYNTETADFVCSYSKSYPGDFSHEEGELYRTKKGAFFIDGQGGPMSRFAVSISSNSWSGSWGIILVDQDTARMIAESNADREIIERFFEVEEG